MTTTAETIADALKELGYNYDKRLGWKRNETILRSESGKLIASKIQNHLERKGQEYIPGIEKIISNLELLQAQGKELYEDECYASIKFNPSAKDNFEDLAKIISGTNYESIYPHILRQIIFTIKSRMIGKTVRCPIFVVFYGDQGIGKSTIVRYLCAQLPLHQYAIVKQGDSLVNSEKHTQMLFDNLVIHLDEMGGLAKSALEKLKTILDMQYASYVPLYENSTKSGFVKATLIGSSNTQVKNILISTQDNRKWVQVNFYPRQGNSEIYCREQIAKIENFDYKTLWQSIDENGEEPFGNPAIYDLYLQYVQKTCQSSSPTVDFIEQLKEDKGGEWIGSKELYDTYKCDIKHDTESKPMRKDLFFETCTKKGFTFKRKAGLGLYGYEVPHKTDPDTLDLMALANN